MVLQLHVWGPAFGLASVDAECLAAITYFAYAVPASAWELVTSSPSAVPTRALPALHETASGTWVSGFTAVTSYLSTTNPAWDLDLAAGLTQLQVADATAYTAFLSSTAAPLLALSLYVSSETWAATTRPAYSGILPFPLTWTEPPAVRRRMCAAAAHLGLSDLNIDDVGDHAGEHEHRGFLKVPERLRPRNKSVRAALAPEQTALFRLEAVARECLGVLADGLGRTRAQQQPRHPGAGGFLFFDGDRLAALDCLAFGYLALMLVPEVPRPWLRDLMRRRYDGLCVFVDSVRDELFGGDVASLPWRTEAPAGSPWRVLRFARGVVEAAVPEDWLLGELSPAHQQGQVHQVVSNRQPSNGGPAVLSALGSSAAVLGLMGSVLLYRHLSPFGSVLYRWEMQRRNLGAAGAFFGI
ncbi:Tom37/Metaxin-1 [Cryphonectria parasitica EP155]|uniref:Tom37/Metaxin-1 n=1 Tax=Cryphonectria parasitica (strain ATCC 38755 / EP155) TaxID=660469 RepID=A0A9P5CP44_CRYP1|nr:Tom37/Metaxin-1 [Cryphonectria parasitica EP155]KAF3764600.1 Tom37/Metaxin-1 [Cryphonectria parasitica EP155]